MLKFWLRRSNLSEGLYGDGSAVEIVEEHSEGQPYEGGSIEPGLSLEDIEAMLHYLQVRFPHGWRRTVDGKIVCGWAPGGGSA